MERVRVQAAAAATAEAADTTLALYDACWFHRCVLLPSPPPPPPAPSPPERVVDDAQQGVPSSIPAAGPGLRHRRTRSDEATTTAAVAFQQGLEPLRIPNITRARLETILSGKDGTVAAPQPQPERRRPASRRLPERERRRRRRGRSMSELEFEELKGLQDLGFTFSDAEVDSELASIVPGLRRKLSQEIEPLLAATAASAPASVPSSSARPEEGLAGPDGAATLAPRRPYLSEAWEDEEEEVRAMLRNWRIPAAVDGADLKEHLRTWAHTVASAVR